MWRVRLDGSQATLVVKGSVAWPDVSPDGKYALYHSVSGNYGTRRISVVRLADGASMNFEADGLRARFAPDGKSIAYISPRGSIVSQPFPSSKVGVARELVSPGESALTAFDFSPDGKRLVVSHSESSGSLVIADGVLYLGTSLRRR